MNDLNIRILCKKLDSGKCQVKFSANLHKKRKVHGYKVTNPDDKLKDVMQDIRLNLISILNKEDFYHDHLYSIGKVKNVQNQNIIFFKN